MAGDWLFKVCDSPAPPIEMATDWPLAACSASEAVISGEWYPVLTLMKRGTCLFPPDGKDAPLPNTVG
eukprot:CAMPEP_0170620794 /NCGR_PEP_ID=MMETSP0224-20130122/28254_1 /TAXON_ID=285029 /ORGANISM="Togula jolla, Strain CCCM 725" /LENGTH=67 /DNA_ID=CAMNT_0010947003 /DNA_START=92 /DNA_END=295 /DNA_ORIENTATION=+